MTGPGVGAVLVDNGGVLTLPDPRLVSEALAPFGAPDPGVDLDHDHAHGLDEIVAMVERG